MTYKRQWYDIVAEQLLISMRNQIFSINSAAGEAEMARIEIRLMLLRASDGIPVAAAQRIALDIANLPISLAASRAFWLQPLAREVVDDLGSRRDEKKPVGPHRTLTNW